MLVQVEHELLVWPDLTQIDEFSLDQITWNDLLTLSQYPQLWDLPYNKTPQSDQLSIIHSSSPETSAKSVVEFLTRLVETEANRRGGDSIN
jgi:hypothetical protein